MNPFLKYLLMLAALLTLCVVVAAALIRLGTMPY